VSGRLAGKSVIVTGGGAGIGRAMCLLFAQEGASVGVLDLDTSAAEACVREIADAGSRAVQLTADVSQPSDTEAAVAVCERAFGPLHVLVNNAGVIGRGTAETTALPEWHRVLETNLTGVYLMAKAAIPSIRRAGGGSIINVSSAAGLAGWYDQAAYDASKGGVVNLSRSMALDFALEGIRVNCLVPAHVTTPMSENFLAQGGDPARRARERTIERIPLGRFSRPEEIAYAALFLASDESSYVTGSCLVVDGGYLAH
jgi:NAD(P)-dependent dehydrogenase (short-subunit alcohol dehydrogenase family)